MFQRRSDAVGVCLMLKNSRQEVYLPFRTKVRFQFSFGEHVGVTIVFYVSVNTLETLTQGNLGINAPNVILITNHFNHEKGINSFPS